MKVSTKLVISIAFISCLLAIEKAVAIKIEVMDASNKTSNGTAIDWYNLPKLKAVDFAEKYFDQKIDHFAKADSKVKDKTFKQRFYVSYKYAQNGNRSASDVLWLGTCGEAKCENSDGGMVEH